MSFLDVIGLHKRYAIQGGEVIALQDLHLTVARGEFVVILGPSGCGKSTLLQIIAGLEPASSGQVRVDGRPVTHWGPERALIFQQPTLFPWLTAEGNVAFGPRMAGMGARERLLTARKALERMGLSAVAQRYPHELSGGMQQRVALARALVLDPALLLMDEPLAALDALLRARLQREIRVACAGRSVLLVTHSIREALVLADRVLILTPQPGRVQREISLDGAAPRSISPALARLEEEIEAEISSPPLPPPRSTRC